MATVSPAFAICCLTIVVSKIGLQSRSGSCQSSLCFKFSLQTQLRMHTDSSTIFDCRIWGLELMHEQAGGVCKYRAGESAAVGVVDIGECRHSLQQACGEWSEPHGDGHECMGAISSAAPTNTLHSKQEELIAKRQLCWVEQLLWLPPERLAGQLHCLRAFVVRWLQRVGYGPTWAEGCSGWRAVPTDGGRAGAQ